MGSGRALLGLVVCLSAAGAIDCDRAGRRPAPQSPEDVWLARIGTGPAQTARACGRGATDRVATVLCAKAPPAIRGLEDLYRALRLDRPGERLVATTTHSLGLSARTVSGLNPRVIVYQNISHKRRPVAYEEVVATSFTRGEQLVEMAALDPASYDYNFYLLRFAQACNRTRCTPEDLLTEKVERGWTDWTLYSERDLEDTALDCASCHMPFGAGTHKQLLMRQEFDPWMHWSDFRGGDEHDLCRTADFEGTVGKIVAVAEGLDLLRAVEGVAGRYAGVPMAELHAAESGKNFATYLADSDGLIRASPYRPADYRYEQAGFSTREVLCERFRTGTSPTWERHRREAFAKGQPVPYYAPDIVDPQRRDEVAADRTAFLRRHAADDAPAVAGSFIAADVAAAVGFVPRPADTAPEILRAMCVRCHAAATDPQLRRARFNAESIDRIGPVTATAVRRRLSLPRTSPDVMPPARVGELPSWAIARIDRYLRDRCTDPGACD
jgi:hypothetical protein